jgi:hypothetical protein
MTSLDKRKSRLAYLEGEMITFFDSKHQATAYVRQINSEAK